MHDAETASYEQALVTYIDILGFSDMIEESRKNRAEIAKLRERLTAMRRVADENTEHRNASGERINVLFDSMSFSDLVVRCTKIRDEPPWFILLMGELHYLATRQAALAAEGVLIRGGISRGDLLITPEKTSVFGPALVRSYKLERELAIYPRIAVDQELATETRKIGLKLLHDLIRRGEDGTYFLDYLYAALATRWEPPMPRNAREGLVEGHRRTIEAAIHNYAMQKDERLRQKHMWLALYHNETVKRLAEQLGAEQFGDTARFLISEDILS